MTLLAPLGFVAAPGLGAIALIAPVFGLASIGRADSLMAGCSYYLAEVESILRLVQAADTDPMHLLIADEVFRGTNSQEWARRLARREPQE